MLTNGIENKFIDKPSESVITEVEKWFDYVLVYSSCFV